MEFGFGCIVEGHGEPESLPVLLRRIAALVQPLAALHIPHPIRIPKSKLLRPHELERAVGLAALNAGRDGAVIVLIDADDDCPKECATQLLNRAAGAAQHRPVSVVLPKCEFENWFLAGAESLRGVRGVAADVTSPPDPEAIRGAKEWLTRHMSGRGYRPTLDQAALAARLDLNVTRARSASFDKFYRDVGRLLLAGGAAAHGE